LTLNTPGKWVNGKWDVTLHAATSFPRTVLTVMRVNWGDGQRDDYYDTPSLLNLSDFTHSYTKPGTYRAKFSFQTYYRRSACDTVQEILITVPGTLPKIGIDTIRCRDLLFSDSSITTSPVIKRTWNFGDGATDTTARPWHSYATDGTYTVRLSIITAARDTLTVARIISLQAPQVELGPDTTITPDQTIVLNAGYPRFSQGAWYLWSTGYEGPTLRVSNSGTYSVKVYYCNYNTPITDTIRVLVAPDSKLTASFGSVRTACYTYRFTDTSKISAGYITRWQWSFGDNTTDTVQHPVHTYSQAGTYAVRLVATDNYGYRDTALNFITIDTSLSINLGPDSAYWSGRAVLGNNMPLRSGLQYQWSTGAATRTILVTTDGTYWVKVTDTLCGRSASDTITLGISAADTIIAHIGIDSIRCNMVEFRDSSLAVPSIIKWEWDFGDGSRDTLRNPLHTYSNNGQYTVRLKVTNGNGVADSTSRVLSLYNIPVVNLGADTSLLPGDTLVLDATKPVWSPWASYNWSTGETSLTIRAATPGTYWVKVSYCGSFTADTIRLLADTLPIADIGRVTTVNANENLTVNVQFDHNFNSNNVFIVQLFGNGTNGKLTEEGALTDIAVIPGAGGQLSLSVKIPDTIPCGKDYRIRVISSAPADSTEWSSKFEVLNMPVATVQQRGDSLFAGKALGYQWYLNNAPVTGATASYYRARANGKYYVVMNNGGDCRATSSAVDVIITAVTDVNAAGSGVKAFPNPTSGIVYIRFEKPLLKPVTIAVFDAKGNQLYTKLQKDQTDQIDLSALPGGVYYLEITGQEKRKAMRVILQ
ncbi:MAG TPA: PKD domain-containing protein, partial [Chitinophaga sp.]